MEEINLRKILHTYKMFSKRQSEILGNLAKTKEIFTFDDLQEALQEDAEAKELLQKIRLIVDGQYEKANLLYSEEEMSRMKYNSWDDEPKQLEILYNKIESIKQEINKRLSESSNISNETIEEYKMEYKKRIEPYKRKIEEILKS